MTPYLNTIWENSAIWELANKLGEIQIHVLTSKGSFKIGKYKIRQQWTKVERVKMDCSQDLVRVTSKSKLQETS